MVPTAIFLFDRTGNMARPWADAGYRCICYDIQHVGRTVRDGIVFQQWDALLGAPAIPVDSTVVFGFAFPPCTDLAVSGARWFKEKGLRRLAQAIEMVAVADEFLRSLGVPYGIENPVSVISSHWRKPDYTFHPYEFTGFELDDNYKKKTCVWAGGGFEMPEPNRAEGLGAPDNRIHAAPHPMTAVTSVRLLRWDSPEQCLRQTLSSSPPEDHTMTTENSRADALTDWTDEDSGAMLRAIDAVERIASGMTQTSADHLFAKTKPRKMTITDAKELASVHAPGLRRLFHKIEGLHPAASPASQPAAAPNEDHECVYENGDGICRECAELAKVGRTAPSPADERAVWQTGAPPVKEGSYAGFIVACRRKHNGEVYVFEANYANQYAEELRDDDGEEFTAHGWYDVAQDIHGEYSSVFSKTCGEGDEIIGWQPLPKWGDAARAASANETGAEGARIDVTLPYENALHELIRKILPDLDSGDILADAQTAINAVAGRAMTDAQIDAIWANLDARGSSLYEPHRWEVEMRRRFARTILSRSPALAGRNEKDADQ